jgi:predicted O-methyltransferase YrrM
MQAIGEERGKFLEIGSYEGRSTCWLLQNGLAGDGVITCIEPFIGVNGFQNLDLMETFEDNTFEAKKKGQYIELHKNISYQSLAYIISEQMSAYDFIYIDGDHSPSVVLTDACMAWGLLRQGGVMLFDDYQYSHEPTKVGIDGFLDAFNGQYEIIVNNYQMGIQKL